MSNELNPSSKDEGFTFTGGTALARDLNRVSTGDRWTQSGGTSHHAILQ